MKLNKAEKMEQIKSALKESFQRTRAHGELCECAECKYEIARQYVLIRRLRKYDPSRKIQKGR